MIKKLTIMLAMLAMLLIAAVPALADNDHNRFFDNHHRFFNDNDLFQANEQDVESADSEQTFNVVGGGDNSNACQNVQGITNTGNAVQNTSVGQFFSDDSELEVDDAGNFTISPESSTSCTQQVDQAATAVN
jgi:hypothetical protein